MLTYKGYHAQVEFRSDDQILRGRVLDLNDTVVFEVETAAEVQSAFKGAVDDYVDFCAQIGKDPDRPYSGRFNVRLAPPLHRAASLFAEDTNQSLNNFVAVAVQNEVERQRSMGSSLLESLGDIGIPVDREPVRLPTTGNVEHA